MSELFDVDGVGVMDDGATVGGNNDEMGNKEEELVFVVDSIGFVIVVGIGIGIVAVGAVSVPNSVTVSVFVSVSVFVMIPTSV